MKTNETTQTVTIHGREYSVDPTNGLPFTRVLQSIFDNDDLSWAIPEGYVEYQALFIERDTVDRNTAVYQVWFGTLAQVVAARDPRCRFIPAEEVAA